MKDECAQAQWLLEHPEISVEELAELSGLPAQLLRELVDDGALDPLNAPAPSGAQLPQWSFPAECIVAVRAAYRLREDFELDANALSVALPLIQRIHKLEAQLRELQSQLPRLKRKG